jgi:hypothetical protein
MGSNGSYLPLPPPPPPRLTGDITPGAVVDPALDASGGQTVGGMDRWAEGRFETINSQSWSKQRAKCKTLIGIFSQTAGVNLKILGQPCQFQVRRAGACAAARVLRPAAGAPGLRRAADGAVRAARHAAGHRSGAAGVRPTPPPPLPRRIHPVGPEFSSWPTGPRSSLTWKSLLEA